MAPEAPTEATGPRPSGRPLPPGVPRESLRRELVALGVLYLLLAVLPLLMGLACGKGAGA